MTNSARFALIAATLVGIGWLSVGPAGAATSFDMSPTSGPPGTSVKVSGHGCTPGLLPGPNDFVAVTAATLDVATRVPVKKDGSWRGSFKVPPSANVGAARVTATCVSDGLSSLTTIYTPRTFVVTSKSSTTPTTKPKPTPPTKTSPGPGPTPPNADGGTTAAPTDGNNTSSTAPVSGSVPAGGPTGPSGSSGEHVSGASGAASTSGAHHPTTVGKIDRVALSAPELPAASVSDAGGLGWVAWALLLAVIFAAVSSPFLLRRIRRRDSEPAVPGGAA